MIYKSYDIVLRKLSNYQSSNLNRNEHLSPFKVSYTHQIDLICNKIDVNEILCCTWQSQNPILIFCFSRRRESQ